MPTPIHDYRGEHICEHAARGGHLHCLKWLHEHGYLWDKNTCSFSALGGYLDCLKYAHENGCPWNIMTSNYAAANGKLECLKYSLSPPTGESCPCDLSTSYAAEEHYDCLKYLYDKGCPCPPWTAHALTHWSEHLKSLEKNMHDF